MSITTQTKAFAELGYEPMDLRHIGVYVQPAIEVKDGEKRDTHKIYIGEGDGDFSIDFPTRLVFLSMTEDWVFESFKLAGQEWPGLSITPAGGDFTVRGAHDGKAVIVDDKCDCFFAFRYQVMMKNTKTGEIVVTDPTFKNGDRQGGG